MLTVERRGSGGSLHASLGVHRFRRDGSRDAGGGWFFLDPRLTGPTGERKIIIAVSGVPAPAGPRGWWQAYGISSETILATDSSHDAAGRTPSLPLPLTSRSLSRPHECPIGLSSLRPKSIFSPNLGPIRFLSITVTSRQ